MVDQNYLLYHWCYNSEEIEPYMQIIKSLPAVAAVTHQCTVEFSSASSTLLLLGWLHYSCKCCTETNVASR